MPKTDTVTRDFISNNTDLINDLYWNQNISVRDIAKAYNISFSVLHAYMVKYHMLRPVGKGGIKYFADEAYFEKIDIERKAYWLGVLYADGCIMHIRNSKYVVFSSIDKEWLEQFKKDINYTGPITQEHQKVLNKDIWKIKITSEKLYRDLISVGLVEAKSKIIKFPSLNVVPAELMNHFIRGYFDGNGSVGLYQNRKQQDWKRLHVSFSCGSEDFCMGLYSWIKNISNPVPKPKKKTGKNTYTLTLSTFAGLQLREYMYSNATIYLKRKHDKMFKAVYPKRTFNDYNRVSLRG